ncbi:hypothetical protein ACTXT7_006379 [Hymenolepis weldensis]
MTALCLIQCTHQYTQRRTGSFESNVNVEEGIAIRTLVSLLIAVSEEYMTLGAAQLSLSPSLSLVYCVA